MTIVKEARIFLPVIFLAAFAVALLLVSVLDDPLTHLQAFFVDQYYVPSAISYILALALSVPLLPFTLSPLIPFVSKVFGPEMTFIFSVIGYALGSMGAYTIARISGRDFVTRIFPEKRLLDYNHIFKTTSNFADRLALRFSSPTDSWSYTTGLREKGIGFRSFFLIGLIGSVPSLFVLTFSADAITSGDDTVLFSLFFAVVLMALSFVYIRYFHGRQEVVKIITHDMSFHADEVFAAAALIIMLEKESRPYEIVRTRDEKQLDKYAKSSPETRFIIDVGMIYDPENNQFDHHQTGGAGKRENGIPYSTIGLVWKRYGTLVAGDPYVAEVLDEKIVQQFDLIDNGKDLFNQIYDEVRPFLVRDLFEGTFRPYGDADAADYDVQFKEAVLLAEKILQREIQHATEAKEKDILAQSYYTKAPNKEMIVLDKKIGRDYFIQFKETKLLVSPRSNEENAEWNIVSVRTGKDMFSTRARFPLEWAGKSGKELEKISGIKGATFCHASGGFIAGAKTKDAAIKMAEEALRVTNKGKNSDDDSTE